MTPQTAGLEASHALSPRPAAAGHRSSPLPGPAVREPDDPARPSGSPKSAVWLFTSQVADRLGLSLEQVRWLIRKHRLPAERVPMAVGFQYKVREDAVDTYAAQREELREAERKRIPPGNPHRHPLVADLIARRRALEIPVDKLAAEVGVAPQTMRRLESGDRQPSLAVLDRWIAALGGGLRACWGDGDG